MNAKTVNSRRRHYGGRFDGLFIARVSSYATHARYLIPFYIYYSMVSLPAHW